MSELNIDAFIGNKIRARRHILGLNQTDLGKQIGVTFQQIQKYEKGHNKILASKLFDLAKKMDVDIEYFFEGLDPKNNQHITNPPKDANLSLHEEQSEFIYDNPTSEASTRESIALIKLFNGIPSKETRKKLLLFLKSLSY